MLLNTKPCDCDVCNNVYFIKILSTNNKDVQLHKTSSRKKCVARNDRK